GSAPGAERALRKRLSCAAATRGARTVGGAVIVRSFRAGYGWDQVVARLCPASAIPRRPVEVTFMISRRLLLVLPLVAGPVQLPLAWGGGPASNAAPPYAVSALPRRGGGADGIGMDVMAYAPRTGLVWAPAGNTGAVDVIDTATGKIRQVSGFATK